MNIQLENHLNPAQLEAVTTVQGPVLVIAGAGSGKTRTIVYRLAHLVDLGLDPESILLLTFTRKAAQEMLLRAGRLLGQGLHGVSGGTFHSFAYGVLRRYASAIGFRNDFTILDRSDAEEILKQVKDLHQIGKGDRSFPKKGTIMGLISKSRNKELDLETLLEKEARHLFPFWEDLVAMADLYQEFKASHGLMDYDDLLFCLERLLQERQDIREFLNLKHSHIMVDEYQDTNLVQGRLVAALAGPEGNVMAVGDDAQSIYSFRGATIQNILQFTQTFPTTKIVKLEQNYRSTQPILHFSNQVLAGAAEKYDKTLFTTIAHGLKPQVLRPMSDLTQAQLVLSKILELTSQHPLHDIAVLFRAGFQSYPLEVALNKASVPFRKYGGLKFTEAAHIKDVLAYLRLLVNPADLPAWQRALSLIPGIGPKTCQRLFESALQEDRSELAKSCASNTRLAELLGLLDSLRQDGASPLTTLEQVLEHYQPILEDKYPDDHPRRKSGLDQLAQIAAGYDDLGTFLSDLSLEHPDSIGQGQRTEDTLVLSTVHSAKGLEWSAVILIDLVEERFPSRHALMDREGMEEERRLFYVACTRAKSYLGLCVPDSLFNKFQNRSEPAIPCPFVQELPQEVFEEFLETFSGNLNPTGPSPSPAAPQPASQQTVPPEELGFCRHKIFGRGKVISFLPPNKFKVNFPGFGLKVILGDYLDMEGREHGA